MRHGRCTIYFAQPKGGGHIKIGATARPEVRHQQIGALFPYGIDVIAMMPGDEVAEAFLHACFAPLATAKEWFQSAPALWRFLLEVIDHGRPAFVACGGPFDPAAFRTEVENEFGSLQAAKIALGYAPRTPVDQIFPKYRPSCGIRARIAFHRALTRGHLPDYIAELHGRVDVASFYAATEPERVAS